MSRRASKVDTTARALTTVARQMGAKVLPLGGAAVDALICFRGRTFIVDFKGPKTRKTATQQKLEAEGWPIHFISTPEDLMVLLDRS